MPKNPNSRSKPVKKDEPMNGAMKFFLGGCVAELYLLLVRRAYTGSTEKMIAWYDTYLFVFAGIGLAALAAGVVLGIVWRADKKRRTAGWALGGAGLFLSAASLLIRALNTPAITFLCVLVPVLMLLGILWSLYDRECAWALTILGAGVLALWLCRKGVGNLYWNTAVTVGAVVFIALLLVIVLLARQADRHGGMVGKVRLLPAAADCLPIYVACGVSAVAVVVALFSTAAAYYAMWALAVVIFALAVYYTVKQL